FKDYFHINLEIKLTQAYFYISINEMDLAENILKSIYRKIKAEELDMYANALDLIKVFNLQINSDESKKTELKQNDLFTLFTDRNSNEFEVLHHLQMELKEKYSK